MAPRARMCWLEGGSHALFARFQQLLHYFARLSGGSGDFGRTHAIGVKDINIVGIEIDLALLIVSIVGLTLLLMSDNFQTIAKYRGVNKQKVASGYNSAMKIMALNRIGAVIFFSTVAFFVDQGVTSRKLVLHFCVSILCGALPAAIAFSAVYFKEFAHKGFFSALTSKGMPQIMIATYAATVFNVLGITIPFALAAIYPDYRLTLANTSFLFNSVYTILNIFYIEDRFAKIADNADNNDSNLTAVILSILVARSIGYLCVGTLLLLMVVIFHIR